MTQRSGHRADRRRPARRCREPAPHVRTYLLPCVLSLVLFFPTAIPGIVHAAKARAARARAATSVTRASARRARRGSGSGSPIGVGLTVWFCLFAVLSIFLNDGAVRKVFLNWDVISDSCAEHPQGLLAEHQAVHGRRGARADLGAVHRDPARVCPAARRRPSGSSPSPTSTSSAPCRPSSSSTWSCSASRSPDLPVVRELVGQFWLSRDRAHPRLRRVRRRGLPRRHREHPLEPERGSAVARPVLSARRCGSSSCRRRCAASSLRC